MTEVLLDVRNISKSFGALVACNDVSLDLRAGEIHALIGPNGAGKSTLMQLILRLRVPTAGHMLVNGETVIHAGT